MRVPKEQPPVVRPMRELLELVGGKLAAIADANGHDAEAAAILAEVRERIKHLPQHGALATGSGTERAVGELSAYAAGLKRPSAGPSGAVLQVVAQWIRMRASFFDNPAAMHGLDENKITEISNLGSDLAYIDDGFHQSAAAKFYAQPILVETGESDTPLLRLTFECDGGDASVGDPGYAGWFVAEDQAGTLFAHLRPGQMADFEETLKAQAPAPSPGG